LWSGKDEDTLRIFSSSLRSSFSRASSLPSFLNPPSSLRSGSIQALSSFYFSARIFRFSSNFFSFREMEANSIDKASFPELEDPYATDEKDSPVLNKRLLKYRSQTLPIQLMRKTFNEDPEKKKVGSHDEKALGITNLLSDKQRKELVLRKNSFEVGQDPAELWEASTTRNRSDSFDLFIDDKDVPEPVRTKMLPMNSLSFSF
jgi:hypothetical protein